MVIFCFAEYLGFNNRTCSGSGANLSKSSTAGPVMRRPSASMMWREWLIRVIAIDDKKLVSLQPFVRPDVKGKVRCKGFVSTLYGNPKFKLACAIPPYGNRLFLSSTQDQSNDNSQTWEIRAVEGKKGTFEFIAANKPAACRRLLAVEGCRTQPRLVDEFTISGGSKTNAYTFWRLVKRYDIVSTDLDDKTVPPQPSLPSQTEESQTLNAPGPVISAEISTTTAYIQVVIESIGGGDGCVVSSIRLTSSGSITGSLEQTVQVLISSTPTLSTVGVTVAMIHPGYNSIYAVGQCEEEGKITERSNELSVFYLPPGESTPQITTPASQPASAPTLDSVSLKVGSESSTVTATWTAGLDSVPPAGDPSFFVACVASGISCPSSPTFDIQRPSVQVSTDVGGLSPNTTYDCYVVAKSSHGTGVCSAKKTIATASQQLTSPQVLGGEIFSASSVWDSQKNPASSAFDGSYGDQNEGSGFWHSEYPIYNPSGIYCGSASTVIGSNSVFGEWLQIQFPQKILISKFSLSPRKNWAHRAPYDGRLVGSNDGNTWSELLAWSNVVTWAYGQDTFFVPSTSTPYSYYRVICEKVGSEASDSANSVQITQFKIFGQIGLV